MALTKRRAGAQRRYEKHRRERKGELRARIFAHASLRTRLCARIFAHSEHFLKAKPYESDARVLLRVLLLFFFQVFPCQGIALLSPSVTE